MKTRYKMIASGILGATVAMLGVAVFSVSHHPRQPAARPTSGSNVEIQVVSSKPVYSMQQNQVSSTVQQMLQAPTATSLDASGFVQSVYAKVGVQLPRTIADQAQTGTTITNPNDLETGDLVFFDLDNSNNIATFDGIYLGGNQFAAMTTHGLKVINLSDSYWSGKFLYGRRVL